MIISILVIGVLFRIWGIMWGLNSSPPLHPDEYGDVSVIEQMIQGDFSKVGLETWYFVYYYFIGLVYILFNKIAFYIGLFFNVFRVESDVVVNGTLIGRITTVILGTGTIYLVYKIGTKLFRNSSIGLLAAFILAIAPLSVAQAHYLESDVPLAFMASLSFLFSYLILSKKTRWFFFGGGLIYGLTFTTKPNGILVIIPFLLSFSFLFFDPQFKNSKTPLIKRMGLFVGAALLGVTVGMPGLFVDASRVLERAFGMTWAMTNLVQKPWQGSWIEGPQGSRFAWAVKTLNDGLGFPFVIIFLIGGIYFLFKKNKEAALLLSFPLVYFIVVGFWGRRFGERDIVVLIPFIALGVSATLLTFFSISRKWKFKAIVVAGTIALLIPPLMKSFQVDFYYGAEDNRDLAELWINQNCPKKSKIAIDGYTPYYVNFPVVDFSYMASFDYYRKNTDYIIMSSLEGDRYFSIWTNNPTRQEGVNLLKIQNHFTLIKEFDLKYQTSQSRKNGNILFPDFLNPLLRFYAVKAAPIKHRIFIPHLFSDVDKSYKIQFLNHMDYEKPYSAMVVKPYSITKRIVRSDRKLEKVQFLISAEKSAKIKIKMGLFSKTVRVNPGMINLVEFRPTISFPFLRNVYPLRIASRSSGHVTVHLVTDPLEMGLNSLNNRDYRKAVTHLKWAAALEPHNLEIVAFLGSAFFLDNQVSESSRQYREIQGKDPQYLTNYYNLARKNPREENWLTAFSEFTHYYEPLLRKRLSYEYLLPECSYYSKKLLNDIKEDNFTAVYGRDERKHYYFKLWSHDYYPRGIFSVNFKILMDSSRFPHNGPPFKVEIFKHSSGNYMKIAQETVQQVIPSKETGLVEVPISFMSDGRYGQLEFVVYALKREVTFKTKAIEASFGIQEQLKENISHILYTQGKLSEWSKDLPAANNYYERLIDLNPGFKDALLVLAADGLSRKDTRKADYFLNRVETLNDNNVSELNKVEALYRKFNPQRADQIRDKIFRLTTKGNEPAINFSDTLELLGSRLDSTTWKRGDRIRGSLYWKCNKPIDTDWAVFVHIIKDGQLVFTADHFFRDGLTSLKSLKTGEVVEDPFSIKVPQTAPPGKYNLVIGLWDPLYSKERLKINFPKSHFGQTSYLVSQITIP